MSSTDAADGRAIGHWDVVRWCLVVPSGFLGCWVAFQGVAVAIGFAFDPPGAFAVCASLVLFNGLAGLLAVGVPGALAPSRRGLVTRSAFFVGLALECVLMFGDRGLYGSRTLEAIAVVSAAVGGLAGIRLAYGLGRHVDRVFARGRRLEGG